MATANGKIITLTILSTMLNTAQVSLEVSTSTNARMVAKYDLYVTV